jgi:dCTP deaminase
MAKPEQLIETMSVLNGSEIRERLARSEPNERLVVSPILGLKEQLRDDQASLDVRLGFQFALMVPSLIDAVDEFEAGAPSLSTLYTTRHVPFGDRIVIHPHQFILGATLEYIRLPMDLMAYVMGRSTWGRLGLIVATAVGIQPGFAGTLTLELRNLGEAPLSLYPGQVVAQLFFHRLNQLKKTGKGLGQYSGAVDILPKRLSPKATHDTLHKLRKAFEKKRKAPSH